MVLVILQPPCTLLLYHISIEESMPKYKENKEKFDAIGNLTQIELARF